MHLCRLFHSVRAGRGRTSRVEGVSPALQLGTALRPLPSLVSVPRALLFQPTARDLRIPPSLHFRLTRTGTTQPSGQRLF